MGIFLESKKSQSNINSISFTFAIFLMIKWIFYLNLLDKLEFI